MRILLTLALVVPAIAGAVPLEISHQGRILDDTGAPLDANHSVAFTVWDVGGQEKLRALWRHYFASTQALIFVVDSSDRARLPEAAEELHRLIKEEELSSALRQLLHPSNQRQKAVASGGVRGMPPPPPPPEVPKPPHVACVRADDHPPPLWRLWVPSFCNLVFVREMRML